MRVRVCGAVWGGGCSQETGLDQTGRVWVKLSSCAAVCVVRDSVQIKADGTSWSGYVFSVGIGLHGFCKGYVIWTRWLHIHGL